MRKVIPPLYERSLNKSNPFSADAFDRERFADNLTNLFRTTEDGLVLTINANWGDGKTTFIKLWEQKLLNENRFIPIYYDAFKNDFSGDAFLSIATLIHESLKQHLKIDGVNFKNREQLKYLKETSKDLAKDLVKMGAGLAVSSLTSGFVSSKSVKDWISKAFNRLTFGTLDVNIDEKFEAHIKSQMTIQAYQNKLTELLSIGSKGESKKLIFFIDELDRCRPDFAIHVIEKVKHLFNIDNTFFILSINRSQLLSTIASVYGVSSDEASIYLQKFVHIETQLPPMRGISSPDNAKVQNYLIDLVKEYEIDENIAKVDHISNVLSELSTSEFLALNPRSLERVMSFISIAIGSCDHQTAREIIEHIVPMAAFKVGNPEAFQMLRSGNVITSQQLSDKCFKWFKDYYGKKIVERASNHFSVPRLDEACRLLDIYEIPEEPKPGTKKSKTKENEYKISPAIIDKKCPECETEMHEGMSETCMYYRCPKCHWTNLG